MSSPLATMILEDLVITDQRLGVGGFGTVFIGQLGEKKVAIKKLSQSEKEVSNLVREASIRKRLRHGKHIVYTYGITLRDENLYIIMEYCERGDLQSHLIRNGETVTYEQKILFCRGILLGLLYCHSMKILHHNIKCSNVILGKNMEPKLIGFGLSITIESIEENKDTLACGIIYWAAPELFSINTDEAIHQKVIANPYPCDVYSLGATFCEISYDGTTEFIDSDDPGMGIILGHVYPIPKDGFLKEIIDKCCQFDRNERISLDGCLSMLDTIAEEQLLVPAVDDKWLRIQQDIQANSKLKLPHSFILHRPTENLVVGPSNLSLLEWLYINNYADAVEYMVQLCKHDQDQIKWLHGISEVCKSPEVANFLQSLMQNNEQSYLRLSNLIDRNPQQFVEMLIKAGASCCSYNLLRMTIERHYNMILQAIIDSRDHFKNWAIHDAVKFGNIEAIKILANAGADLERKDDYNGNTPLITAIENERIEAVKILLEFGVDVHNKSNYTQGDLGVGIPHKPLHLAALKGNREIVKLLIDAGATVDITSNEWHSLSQYLEQQGNISMVRFINNSINKKSSTVESNSLCTAIQNKQFDLAQTLVDNGANIDEVGLDGYASLHWAVAVGSEEIVRILVREGADLDTQTSDREQNFDLSSVPEYFSKCTPLHIAVAKGHLEIAKLLIESGADFSAKNGLQQTVMDIAKEDRKALEEIIKECAPVNAASIQRAMKSISLESTEKVISKQQVNTETLSKCLCIAAGSGKDDLVKYLLKCGAHINEKYQGITPLGWAIFGGSIQTMKVLINAGADINAKNSRLETPLFQCVWESQVDMVQLLVDKEADVNIRNEDGKALIHYTRDREIIQILINAGADVNAKSKNGRTRLFQCVLESNTELVQFLVDKSADVNAIDSDGVTPIYCVKDIRIAEILIAHSADVNKKDQKGRLPILEAMKMRNIDMLQLLIDYKVDPRKVGRCFYNSNQYSFINNIDYSHSESSVLHLIAMQRKSSSNPAEKWLNIAKSLIEKGADVNATDDWKQTPLHLVDSVEMADLFVNHDANVNALDNNGRTPIHTVSNTEVVQLLVNSGADMQVKDVQGKMPIFQHLEKSHAEIVRILIDNGADVNSKNEIIRHIKSTEAADKNQNEMRKIIQNCAPTTVDSLKRAIESMGLETIKLMVNNQNVKPKVRSRCLCVAAKHGKVKIVEYFVKSRADVNSQYEGKNVLEWAISGGCMKVMETLINAGADINVRDKNGRTLLFQCVVESRAEVVQFLIEKGANVNVKDGNGNAPIHHTNNREIMEILINAGADVNAINRYGRVLLVKYVKELNIEMMRFLIEKGADVNVGDNDGNAPIHYTNNREILKILINAGADINAKGKYGRTPLIQSVSELRKGMVQYLIDKGADANARDNDGNAPIHHTKSREIMKILIDSKADVDAENQHGEALLIHHVKKSNTEVVRFLVDKGADMNIRDKNGNALIHHANGREIVRILINAGANINAKNQVGETPLIRHVKESNTEIVQFLVEKGANVNAEDKDGNTPIYYANNEKIRKILAGADSDFIVRDEDRTKSLIQNIENSDTEMVQFLADEGVNVNNRNEYGNAPIHFIRDKEIAKVLVNAGADINAKNRSGTTCLIQNINKSNVEIVRFLIEKGADVNIRDRDGNAPIHHTNNREIMEILINAGADINAKDRGGTTCLIQNIQKLKTEIVRFLIDKGAHANVGDKNGNAPIHHANGREIVRILINAGADIDAKDQVGETPLIRHVKESNTEIVQFLVDKGADVNIGDNDGNAPIHHTKSREIMEILINAGADINARDHYGWTPLIQHIRKSNAEIVQYLVDKRADVNARDKDENVSTHFVRDKNIAEILVNAGADINAKNIYGENLFNVLIKEQNMNLSNKQYERKKACELVEYLRNINKV